MSPEGKKLLETDRITVAMKPNLGLSEDSNDAGFDFNLDSLDEDLIRELAGTHKLLVTIEENVVSGGAGAAVSEYLAAAAISIPILHLGIPDQFIDHGKHSQQLKSVGLDTAGILKKIDARLDLLKVSQKP